MTNLFSKRIKMPILIFIVVLFSVIKILFVYFAQVELVVPEIVKSNSMISQVLISHTMSAQFFSNMDLFLNSPIAKSLVYLFLTLVAIGYFYNYMKLLTNNISTSVIACFILAINGVTFIGTSINLPSAIGFFAIAATLHNLQISKFSKQGLSSLISNFLIYLIAFFADYNLIFIITTIILIQNIDLKKNLIVLFLALIVFLGYFSLTSDIVLSQFANFYTTLSKEVFLSNLKLSMSSYMILILIFATSLSKTDTLGIPQIKVYSTSLLILLLFIVSMFVPSRFIMFTILNYTTLLIIPFVSILLNSIMNQDSKNRISAYIYMLFILLFSVYNAYSFYNYLALTIPR